MVRVSTRRLRTLVSDSSREARGADRVCSKQFQRSLSKQGLKFMLNTKVVSAEKKDGKVYIKTESAKGGKEETVSTPYHLPMD